MYSEHVRLSGHDEGLGFDSALDAAVDDRRRPVRRLEQPARLDVIPHWWWVLLAVPLLAGLLLVPR